MRRYKLTLQTRKYSYAELQEFKNSIKTNKNIDILLNNIQALRLLGWTITLGRRISAEKLNGYGDVIKYSSTINKNKAILLKKQLKIEPIRKVKIDLKKKNILEH